MRKIIFYSFLSFLFSTGIYGQKGTVEGSITDADSKTPVNGASENILNREWREAQFDTESRLRFEQDPVSEIHYTPGTPASVKGSIIFNF